MALVAEQQKFKIKKDDTVEVIAGKDKGKRGRILRILRNKNRVIVEGANMVKKAQKRRNQQDRGGIIDIEAALHASNVQIVCGKCGKPVRIGYKIDGDKKIRVCKKCGEAL
ncbi:MAG: 50S ribosomal protein L24 [Spirochaetaceae bacterium]|jgi:large subunit ribosomal protein L24|nr:50S ribosomal protein L24 [Spirochaetaceae bacterium]